MRVQRTAEAIKEFCPDARAEGEGWPKLDSGEIRPEDTVITRQWTAAPALLVGIVGKPNVGKSTFFSAATLKNVPIADYPFTTINPNLGMGYLRTKCVCKEMGVTDTPKNSVCNDGVRLIPVKLVDVAGLVSGASEGRGRGNQFLDEIRQADALIHVVDASGGTDEEGRKVEVGSQRPRRGRQDGRERARPLGPRHIKKDWEKSARLAEQIRLEHSRAPRPEAERAWGSTRRASRGLVLHLHMKPDKPTGWTDEDLMNLVQDASGRRNKPSLHRREQGGPAGSGGEDREAQGRREGSSSRAASEAELLLRRASEHGLIKYTPGDGSFEVAKADLTPAADAGHCSS